MAEKSRRKRETMTCGVADLQRLFTEVSQIDWKVILRGKADAESKLECMKTTRKSCF